MTHEELLEQIQTFGSDESYGVLQLALRAVVELHKPEIRNYLPDLCEICDTDYPCLTIQVIDKELK